MQPFYQILLQWTDDELSAIVNGTLVVGEDVFAGVGINTHRWPCLHVGIAEPRGHEAIAHCACCTAQGFIKGQDQSQAFWSGRRCRCAVHQSRKQGRGWVIAITVLPLAEFLTQRIQVEARLLSDSGECVPALRRWVGSMNRELF